MAPWSDVVAATSSVALRLASYIFLRWIPGHWIPPAVWTLLAIYITSFGISFGNTQLSREIAEELDEIAKANGDPNGLKAENKSIAKNNGILGVSSEEPNRDDTSAGQEYRQSQALKTVLSGIPSQESLLWSAITVAINLLLAGMVTDYVYNAPYLHNANDLSFARLGFVSETSAKILVREPRGAELPIFIRYRNVENEQLSHPGLTYEDDSWKTTGKITWLSEDTDYTAAIVIDGLRPDTQYEYSLSNNHSDTFTTAPKVGHVSRHTHNRFNFFHSSCIKPNFPYDPFSHPLSVPGFQSLAAVLPYFKAHFMIFLGDFIYIDVPRRLGENPESYRREYRQVYASPDWPAASRSLPWIHVLDDHEIANDWDRNTTAPYPAAVDPWHHYHTSVNPPAVQRGATYFQFTQGPASFFLLDTRRYRDPIASRDATDPEKTMLGKEQLDDVLTWLKTTPPLGVRWRVLVSSVPFTRNWRVNSGDTWAGYLSERQKILETMWDVKSDSHGTGVIVLSGDRHEFAATELVPPHGGKWDPQAAITEFSCSPLNMFWLPWRTYWEYPVRPYHENDTIVGEDRMIKYIPGGTSKFGAVEIFTPPASDQSVLQYRLFVHGKETWSYILQSPAKGSIAGMTADRIWG